ncbi:unnamed protein product [Spirodela intermedia]|uniref:Uncharacterized protein n=2 Tax=Spirodela intermedia TaxID=51605 RepID=A0A7I8JP94_SPIIN|nr:unnamed protein product [Spirodela intermedia]CAA6671994.1 unnamed protein product [Spirodela intermedia]CAA7409149.1 unnamed protein product [Spirodela intermedia]
MHSTDGVCHSPQFVLGGGELLLEGDMRGSEALVVNKQTLNLLMLSCELLLDDGGVERPKWRATESGKGPVHVVVKEAGVSRPAERRKARLVE